MKKDGAVIACSALKEKYRTVLCAHIITPVFWVFLKGSYELIKKRMEERTGHYMPVSLLESQFATLEEPTDAITVDTAKSPDEIVEIIVSEITKKEHLKSLN